jgi:tetratricopeptide (TPR) repeat protein
VEDLCVRLPREDGSLGEPLPARYDATRSRPEKDAAVLRLEGVRAEGRPVLHRLGLDSYDGALRATVLTHLTPDNFDAEVRASTRLSKTAAPSETWPAPSGSYDLRVLRLSAPSDARRGISGGVVVCEGGVLGLVHFAREERAARAREDYLVPLSAWSDGWQALEDLVEPLVDENLRSVAVVKRASDLEVGTDLVVAGYRRDVYEDRGLERLAWEALERSDGVVIVGRPKAGKTRLVLELLRENPDVLLVMPLSGAFPPRTFEASGFCGEDVVVVFDDLHRTADTAQPLEWQRRLGEATEGSCRLVCTSRDGADWSLVKKRQEALLDALGWDAAVFTSRAGEPGVEVGEDLSEEQGERLAEALGLPPEEFERRFDGTPGSLILNLEGMKNRYEALREEQMGGVPMNRLLDSAKLLHKGGQGRLSGAALRVVAEEIRGSGGLDADVWEALRRRSQGEGFGTFDNDGSFQVYRPYLEQCVTYEPAEEEVDRLLPVLASLGDAEGLALLGASYGPDTDRSGKALACFDCALEIDPNQPMGWYGKALALSGVGRREDAVEAYEEVLRLRPELFEVWVNKAMVLNELGRHEEALASSERALEINPRSEQAWLTKGVSLSGLERAHEALEAYDKVIEINPEVPSAWHNRAKQLDALGNHREATQALDVALHLRPDYGLAHQTKGRELAKAGRHLEAIESYERALTYGSGYPHEDWHGKGMSLNTLGRHQEALEAIEVALSLEPEYAEGWHSKGIALDESGRHGEALEAFDRAIELKPHLPQPWHSRGVVLVKLGRLEDALVALDEAANLEQPASPDALLAVVEVLSRLGRLPEALGTVDRAIPLDPRRPEPWYVRGELLREMGRLAESDEAFAWATWLAAQRPPEVN